MNSTKNILGLTGYYCSGKSSVEKILSEKYKFQIIDVDKIGHAALKKKKNEIIKSFGNKIITNNEVNRKALGSIVFKNKSKRLLLNSIVHPYMIDEVKTIIRESQSGKICINAALLFEMGLDNLCNQIIVIKSSILNIIRRAKRRDNNSIFKILRIIISQNGIRDIKRSCKNADIHYIKNNYTFNDLEDRISNLILKKGIL